MRQLGSFHSRALWMNIERWFLSPMMTIQQIVSISIIKCTSLIFTNTYQYTEKDSLDLAPISYCPANLLNTLNCCPWRPLKESRERCEFSLWSDHSWCSHRASPEFCSAPSTSMKCVSAIRTSIQVSWNLTLRSPDERQTVPPLPSSRLFVLTRVLVELSYPPLFGQGLLPNTPSFANGSAQLRVQTIS